MFVNDWSGHYGGHWQYPGTWIGQQQNPYFGWGTIPQNYFGFGGNTMPHFQHGGNFNTGWYNGQGWPQQNTMMHPYNTGMQHQGISYNTNTPYTNTYPGQGFTPFHGNFNNPFLGCR